MAEAATWWHFCGRQVNEGSVKWSEYNAGEKNQQIRMSWVHKINYNCDFGDTRLKDCGRTKKWPLREREEGKCDSELIGAIFLFPFAVQYKEEGGARGDGARGAQPVDAEEEDARGTCCRGRTGRFR